MKFYRNISFLFIALVGLSLLIFAVSRQAAIRKENSEESFTVNLGESLPKGAKLVEISEDGPPALFQFLMESDYVVIGSGGDARVVGKRDKKPANSKDLDISEWMVGSVYPINVESILFSKKAFKNNTDPVPIPTFETYTKSGTGDGVFMKGTRYLVFLKEIPKDEDIFSKLELDKNKTYYRTVLGNQSLFPSKTIDFHGPSKKGKINLSTGNYAKLAESIQRFCDALSTVDKKERFRKLQELAMSDDKMLQENAEYAIKSLSQQ